MRSRFLLILLAIIVAVNIVHVLVAVWIFRRNKDKSSGHTRLSYEEIKRRREALNSLIICMICFPLPHRIREFFVLTLHFVINSIKAKLLLVIHLFSSLLGNVSALLVYFIGIPLTIGFKKIISKETIFKDSVIEESDVSKRY